jgi:hypothetical protein
VNEVAFCAVVTTAKTKLTRPKASTTDNSLESVYEELVKIMNRHAPPFRADLPLHVREKKAFQLTVPKPVTVPGVYGGKPVYLQLAAAILQKGYVGFYIMCMHMNHAAKQKISPALLKLLKGKACFHLKKLDHGLRQDIEATLELGAKSYKERGWL